MATAAQAREKQHRDRELSALAQTALLVAISIALLLPCVWQDHILAGDLSSHVYNAWLAGEIAQHSIDGLSLTHPITNILTDLPLAWLLRRFGPIVAERVVTGGAVLVFFWGAFFLATAVSTRRAWALSPILAMLAYGLIFHRGFLNFYLSVGLSFWIVGLLWKFSPARAAISAPVIVLAFLAHALPLTWAAAALVYAHLLRRVAAQMRIVVLLGAFVVLVGLQATLIHAIPSRWSLSESVNLLGVTGVDQVWLFDAKYLIVVAGLAAVWCALFLQRLDLGCTLQDPLVHLWLLQLAAYVLMPSAIQLPHYPHVLAYLPERMSLLNAVMLCAVFGRARYGRGMLRASAAVAALFFAFLYIDLRAFSIIDHRIEELGAQAPNRARFVAEVSDPSSRINLVQHSADWACIGHCFSYADYEPATGQFRIRVHGPNPAAADNMADVQDIEEGRHFITPAESPLYSVCRCEDQNPPLCLRRLEAGEKTCSFSLPIILAPGSWLPGWLARKNQSEIPNHQARVPVVDPRNHREPASPHAQPAQSNRN